MRWYAYLDGEVQGPFEKEKLAGKISPEIQVCPAGSEDWQKAGEVEELKSIFEEKKQEKTPAPPEPSKEEEQTDQSKKTTTSRTSQEKDSGDTELGEPPEIPTLKDLHMISKQAADDELTREYEEFWDEYDRAEKRILRNEMIDRSIWPEDDPEEQEQGVL